MQGKEVLTMHPKAAHERGIATGDLVRVFNQRGACLAGVTLDNKLRVDTVVLPVGSWFKPCPETRL